MILYISLMEISMHQNFADSIQFYQAACKMHPKLGGGKVTHEVL